MTYQPQKDFGTPESRSDEAVSLTIDGRNVTVPAGTSVMRAAAEQGTSIPKLCATDSVKSYGSCRLCLVEIDGRRGTISIPRYELDLIEGFLLRIIKCLSKSTISATSSKRLAERMPDL